MKLSILIPTLKERAHMLSCLLVSLEKEKTEDVEVLIDDSPRHITTGHKRNLLIERATGEYIWFIDDDDEIVEGALTKVLKAIESGADVIGIDGYMTTDGAKRIDWEIRLGHPYKAIQRDGKEVYLRFPNHITPMKRDKVKKFKFPDKTVFEDYEWAKYINDSKVLKTQAVVDGFVYHYKCRSKKDV